MPKLKGRAAEVRAIGPALLHAWGKRAGTTDAAAALGLTIGGLEYKQINAALNCCNEMERVLDDCKGHIKLDTDDYDNFSKFGFNFLVFFNALGHKFSEVYGKKLFNVTVKCHYLAHALLQAKWINPRLGWCYGGEDFMFHTRRLMASCCRGNKPAKAVSKFARHYRIAMHLQFLNR